MHPRRRTRVALVCLGILLMSFGCASSPSLSQRAQLLADKGRYAEASAMLEQHLVEHPDAVAERRLLLRIRAAEGRMDAVEREAQTLRSLLGPESPIPWLELGHAFELQHDYERALSMYDHAARAAPQHPAGPLTGGLRAARWGEVELARPRLEESLRRDPSNARAWHALGLVCLHQGDVAAAKLAYESGIRADPSGLDNRIGLATLALTQEDWGGALEQYDAILADRPNLADAHLGRSFVLIRMRRWKEARQALETGYRLGATPSVVERQRALLDRLEPKR